MKNSRLKWTVRLYHNVFVYLPVFLLFGLIFLSYIGYHINYLYILLNSNIYNNLNYPFYSSSSLDYALYKGIILIIFVNFFFIMLLISMIKTIFMNPGYFDSVQGIEHKIILSQCIQSENNKVPDSYKPRKTVKVVKNNCSSNDNILCINQNNDLLDSNSINCNKIEDTNSCKETTRDISIKKNITLSDKRNIMDIEQYNSDDRIEFLNDFTDIITSVPLYYYEQQLLNKKINQFLNYSNKDKIININDITSSEINNENDNSRLNINSTYDNNLKNKSSFKIKKVRKNDSILSLNKVNASIIHDYNTKYIEKNIFNLEEYYKSIDIGKIMLCVNCLRYKIERSHHCRQCGKCVLKMDHHCPWLANCIGFRNYKFFLLIEFHGIIASLIIMLSYWEAIIGYYLSNDATIFQCWFVSFSYICNFCLFIFLSWLFIINWKLALTGQTVIENSGRERFPLNNKSNIYNIGYYKNFVSVFGKNPIYWFLPFKPNYEGEGIIYETIYNEKYNLSASMII